MPPPTRMIDPLHLVAAILATACFAGCGFETEEVGGEGAALVGGTDLGLREPHTGILVLGSFDGATERGGCTATVLYSSAAEDRTWLVTAAHCFSYIDDLHFVYGHFATPRASVRYAVRGGDRCPESSVSTTCRTDPTDSTVYVHPEWLGNGGHTAWFGPRDMAFVRIDTAIPVYDGDERRIEEYRRPIYAGPPEDVAAPTEVLGGTAQYAFCGQSTGALRCDQLTNLWYSPSFRHQFLQLPHGAWTGGFYAAGDSGGPLLGYARHLAPRWGGTASDATLAKRGVVLGVLQGPTVYCDYIQNGNCNPSDGLATHFEGVDAFLATIPGSRDIPRIYQISRNWSVAFGNGFGWRDGPEHFDTIRFPDLNGDRRADVCGRAADGIRCSISMGTSFGPYSVWSGSFSDGNGWTEPKYYETIEFPDVDGDGRDDVCGRGAGGVWCALSFGLTFSSPTLWSSNFSDANGWGGPEYYRTLQFADVDGDGRDDLCGRGGPGIWCARSMGYRFAEPTLWTDQFRDSHGWNRGPEYYETIRLADVDGDGAADVCGRGRLGVYCARSTGTEFGTIALWSGRFSDANGWSAGPQYYGTLRFPDVNADGRADVCGRGAAGIECGLSSGAGFGSVTVWQGNFSDANGWNGGPQYYGTIEFPDVDGDYRADVCGRGGAGVYCATSNGQQFLGPNLTSSIFGDGAGWDGHPSYFGTIAYPDVTGDGRADVCGRGASGMWCGTGAQ